MITTKNAMNDTLVIADMINNTFSVIRIKKPRIIKYPLLRINDHIQAQDIYDNKRNLKSM